MTPTLAALVLFALWMIGLKLLIAGMRSVITLSGRKKANDFAPSGEDLGGFSQRLARVHANCYENIGIVAVVLLAAVMSGQGAISDQYAMWILYARVAQSLVHLASTSVPAVFLRFGLYVVQLVLLIVIAFQILAVI